MQTIQSIQGTRRLARRKTSNFARLVTSETIWNIIKWSKSPNMQDKAKGNKSVLRLQPGKSLLPMKNPSHAQYVFKRQGKREARAGAENSREAGATGMELSNSKEEDIIPHKEQSSTWSKKIDSHCRHLKHIWEANTGDNFAGYDKAAKSSIMTEDMRTSRTTAGGRDKVLLILSCRTSETKIETTHKAIKTSSVTKRQQRAELEQPVQRDITGQ